MEQAIVAQSARKPWTFLRLAGTLLVLTIAFLACNYALNGLLAFVDKEPIRDHLRTAFEQRELDVIGSRGRDDDLGVHQTNDCLIFDMAARDFTGDPLYLFAGGRTGSDRADKPGNCAMLRGWLSPKQDEEFHQVWYLRYIHGYRAVAIGLLRFLPVAEARDVMKAASYTGFTSAILINLVFAFASLRRKLDLKGFFRSRFLGYALATASMIPFFGFPYFAQSISHAPELVTMSAFIIGWSSLDFAGRLDYRNSQIAIIIFALFTGYFEFLTGYIPVGVCLIVVLVAIGWCDRTNISVVRLFWFIVACEAVFVTTFIALFALHTIATSIVDGKGFEVIGLFIDRLSSRMAQTTPGDGVTDAATIVRNLTLLDVGAALMKQLGNLGRFSPQTVLVAFLAMIGLSIAVAYDCLFAKVDKVHRFGTLIAASAFVPVLVWILLFQNHTTIHAAFMVRILVVVPLASVAGLWCWYRAVSSASRTLTQSSNYGHARFTTKGYGSNV